MKITVDEQVCVGCRLCEQACVFGRCQHFNPDESCIQVLFGDDGGIEIEISSGCENCVTPFCMRFCPVGAITLRAASREP